MGLSVFFTLLVFLKVVSHFSFKHEHYFSQGDATTPCSCWCSSLFYTFLIQILLILQCGLKGDTCSKNPVIASDIFLKLEQTQQYLLEIISKIQRGCPQYFYCNIFSTSFYCCTNAFHTVTFWEIVQGLRSTLSFTDICLWSLSFSS